MKHSITLFTFILLSLTLFAQNSHEKENRKVPYFKNISARSGIDVYVTQGNEISVKVEASKNSRHRIITEVKGETLHIYVEGKFRWIAKDIRKVYVTAPTFTSIEASGGSDIRGTDTIKSELLSLSSSEGADIYLIVQTSTLKLNCSEGADINVKGTSNQLVAVASAGSDIDAKNMRAKYVDAKASGGADIEVFAIELLNADASSGSDIKYTGSPKEKNMKESSGGDIKQF
jgi:hypothetical protein